MVKEREGGEEIDKRIVGVYMTGLCISLIIE